MLDSVELMGVRMRALLVMAMCYWRCHFVWLLYILYSSSMVGGKRDGWRERRGFAYRPDRVNSEEKRTDSVFM